MEVLPIADLVGDQQDCIIGVGGSAVQPKGYVIVNLQVDAANKYNEDAIAVVIPDASKFASRVPMILGTCTLGRVVEAMKESELESLTPQWDMVRYARELVVKTGRVEWKTAGSQCRKATVEGADEVLTAWRGELLEPYATYQIKAKIKARATGAGQYVLIHTLPHGESKLPIGVEVRDTYTRVQQGKGTISVVVQNMTPNPVFVPKGTTLARLTEAQVMPKPNVTDEVLKKLEEIDTQEGNKVLTLTRPERVQKLMEDLDLQGLDSHDGEVRRQAYELFEEYQDIFALEPGEIGCCDLAEHRIRLNKDEPFKERYRPINPRHQEEVRDHIQKMLRAGAIKPSNSPWSNAVVLVRKKDGDLRFCIDFRRLNAITKKDSFPLPRIQEAIEFLSGARVFSCIDLNSGFWQIPMEEESKPYTAFTVGSYGFYQFERMPFGLCNAPATFQRCMQECLGELNLNYCLIYMDDIVVYARTLQDHLYRLRRVFDRFREHRLKLKPSKCAFFKEEITYLGHRVSAEGVKPATINIDKILEKRPPRTYTEIREFLGMVNHYRRFIKDCSKISRPLTAYTEGEGSKRKTEEVRLEPEALGAFQQLKEALTEAPVLAYADFTQPFLLETDASSQGLGAVLSQKKEDGRFHPVAYGSRSLAKEEKNYHSTKLEFLALYWAVTQQFKDYLWGRAFTVKTDNNPLTYIMSSAHLDATRHRWVGNLASYTFNLEYQKGKHNVVADTLSRYVSMEDPDVKQFLTDALSYRGAAKRADAMAPEMQSAHEEQGELAVKFATFVGKMKTRMHVTDWAQEQREDTTLLPIIEWLEDHKRGKSLRERLEKTTDKDTITQILRVCHNLTMKNGKLYRQHTLKDDCEDIHQFVVPTTHRVAALNACHRDSGHQGQRRTQELLRERFWWPLMMAQAEKMVHGCRRCDEFSGSIQKAQLNPIRATQPWELVHIDFTTIEIDMNPKKENPRTKTILVLTDHFTRFAQAHIVPDQKAETVAQCLHERVFPTFGAPGKLVSDRGRAFESEIIRSVCQAYGVRKLRTTPYHPQGNGPVERFHQTMAHMIGKLDPDEKAEWPLYLPALVQAYNGTRSAVTGYSPHYLMFGRRPRLPVDVYFPTIREKPETTTRVSSYVSGLKDLLRRAYGVARSQTEAEAARQKRYYDRRANAPNLEPGDLVLLRLSGYKGKRKVIDRWESQPWTVVRQLPNDTPAYEVMAPGGGRRVLHRNRLFLLETADSAAPIVAAFASVRSNEPTNHSDEDSSSEELQEDYETEASREHDDDSGILGFVRMARLEWITEGLKRALPWAPRAAPD